MQLSGDNYLAAAVFCRPTTQKKVPPQTSFVLYRQAFMSCRLFKYTILLVLLTSPVSTFAVPTVIGDGDSVLIVVYREGIKVFRGITSSCDSQACDVTYNAIDGQIVKSRYPKKELRLEYTTQNPSQKEEIPPPAEGCQKVEMSSTLKAANTVISTTNALAIGSGDRVEVMSTRNGAFNLDGTTSACDEQDCDVTFEARNGRLRKFRYGKSELRLKHSTYKTAP